MTRETRIGLLLGLMFIILFGLVLTNLLGTDAPPPPTAPPVIETSPYAWTPVAREITLSGDEQVPLAARRQQDDTGRSAAAGSPRVEAAWAQPAGRQNPSGGVVSQIYRQGPAGAPSPMRQAGPRRPERTYTVQANDNLIRIARKVYGPGRGGQYRRIYEANKNILPDESTLSIGQRLVIPPLPGGAGSRPQPTDRPTVGPGAVPRDGHPRAAAVVRSGPGGAPGRESGTAPGGFRRMDLEELRRHFSARPSAPGRSGRIYVVRRGDSLTGIARRMMKDDSREAVMKIYNANRDKLNDPDCLPVGVRLQIPS